MDLLRLEVHLDEPTFVGAGAVGNVLRGLGHIPGGTLRGALAAAWISWRGAAPQDDSDVRVDFLRIFEHGGRFGPLRADSGPVPLSVRSHKYPAPSCPELTDLAQDAGAAPGVCPNCQQPLEPSRPQDLDTSAVTKIQLTAAGTAEKGALYTREAIRAGEVLTGMVLGRRSDLEKINQLWFGGRRTVAGLATVTDLSELTDDEVMTLLPETRQDADGNTETVIYLSSPAIFVDRFGSATDRPSEEELTRVFGEPAKVTRSWSRLRPVGGWHTVSALPKPVEWATSEGSVFIVTTPHPPSDQVLRHLVLRGLGLRRSEGFGHAQRHPGRERAERRHIAAVEAAGAQRAETAAADDEVVWPRAQRAIDYLRQNVRTQILNAITADAKRRASGEGPYPDLLDRIASTKDAEVPLRHAATTLLELQTQQVWRRVAEALETP